MEDNLHNTQLPNAPKPISNEIDDLLAEAEALSQEITSGVIATAETTSGLLEAERFAPAEEPAEESIETPPMIISAGEPMEAIEAVQSNVDDLKDLLNDPDGGKDAAGDAMIAAPGPHNNSSNAKAKKGSKFNLPKREVETSEAAHAPQRTTTEAKPDIAPAPIEKKQAPAAPDQTKPTVKTGRMKTFFARMIRQSTRGLRASIAVLLNLVVGILAILDWPFRALSPKIKGGIGLAGLVTLFMGMMSWVLPGMMQSNPFEHMDTGIATKGGAAPAAAADGHGEAAPAESHGEAAAPAAHH